MQQSMNPNSVTASQQPPTGSPPSSGSMFQIGGGPAGTLYTLSNEMIRIYNELEELYKQITLAENSVQRDTINAAADGQRSAGQQQANALWAQAAGSIASAGISIGMAASEFVGNRENSLKLGTEDAELSKLNELKGLTPPNKGIVMGDGAPQDRLVSLSPRGRALIDEDNESLSTADAGKTPEQIKQANQNAVSTMNSKEYKAYQDQLQEKITAQEKKVNTTQTQINYNLTKWNLYKDLANGGANAVSQGVQANYTSKGGQAQAANQVASGVSQMADKTSSNALQQNGAAAQAVTSAIQAAAKGSEAYANT